MSAEITDCRTNARLSYRCGVCVEIIYLLHVYHNLFELVLVSSTALLSTTAQNAAINRIFIY